MASEKSASDGAPNMAPPPVTRTTTYASSGYGAGAGPSGVLNDRDPRWRCCCNSMHVRTGAYAIVALEIALNAMCVTFLLFGLASSRGRNDGPNKGAGIGHMTITVILCALMIYGLRARKRFFLVPHMVYQIIAIIGLIILSIIVMLGAAVVSTTRAIYEQNDDSHREDSEAVDLAQGILIALAVFCVLVAALEIWFFIVVLRAYRYLREIGSASSYGSPMMSYGHDARIT